MADRPFNILSLCTGGLGLDRGIGLAVPCARTICCVEHEAFAAGKLVQGMAAQTVDDCPVWSDLRTFDGRPWRGVVDCLTAGFPCQPFSCAGKRAGVDDPRHLWPHVARIIAEAQPGIVFLENVPGLLSVRCPDGRTAAQLVFDELAGLGYEIAAGCFSAAEVGAPHLRLRLFILGVADGRGGGCKTPVSAQSGQPVAGNGRNGSADAARRGQRKLWKPSAGNGLTDGRDEAVDNAAVPRHEPARSEQPQQPGGGQCVSGLGCDNVDNASDRRPEIEESGSQHCGGSRAIPLFPPGPADLDRWREVLNIDPSLEPAICSVAARMVDRRDWLRLLGNGVVPLAAANAFVSLAACIINQGESCAKATK